MAETSRESAAIRAGIERARVEIEESVAALRKNVDETLDWRHFARKHPTGVFCGAVALGVLFARWTSR